MSSDNLLNDLEDIVNKGLEDSPIPYAKGNSTVSYTHLTLPTIYSV